jgi:hypothetical protein
MNEADFRALTSMFDSKRYPEGSQILSSVLKLTQTDENGELFSKKIPADKNGRMT